MAEVISILNFKGGVGKTTTAANLGTALWLLGKRVLLIDTDPQCNLTSLLGFKPNAEDDTFYEWITSDNKEYAAPIYDRYEGLHFIPSSRKVRDAETLLTPKMSREKIFANRLKLWKGHFDYVLIDCCPKEGLINFNSIVASDQVLIPVECSSFALQGMQTLIDTIEQVCEDFNEHICIRGILPIKYDKNTRISKSVVEYFENEFPGKMFTTKIRKSVRFDESPLKARSIFEHDVDGNGAEDYMKLAEEITGEHRPDNWKERIIDAYYTEHPEEKLEEENQ